MKNSQGKLRWVVEKIVKSQRPPEAMSRRPLNLEYYVPYFSTILEACSGLPCTYKL